MLQPPDRETSMQAGKAKFSFTKIIVDDLDRPATFYKAAFG
jgi:hypothetical protein